MEGQFRVTSDVLEIENSVPVVGKVGKRRMSSLLVDSMVHKVYGRCIWMTGMVGAGSSHRHWRQL